MKFVLIIGPQAVGKMTVGQALAARTGLRLFHNHMTIELVRELLPLDKAPAWELVKELRECIFRAFAQSDEAGLIFTGLWAFDSPTDYAYFEGVIALWRELCPTAEVFVVELEADFDERLRRNGTGNRLFHKPSKRDIAWSEADLRKSAREHQLNSAPGEITEPNYLRIDNTHISAEDAAAMVCGRFGF
jgi:hypothetical protein